MSALRPVSLFVAGALSTAGCAGPEGPNDPSYPAAHTFANGPAEPGPIIVRFADDFGSVFVNFTDHIVSLHSPNDGLRIDFTDCQSVTEVDPAAAQIIFTPSGGIHALFLAQESFVSVFDWTGEPTIDCAFVTDPARLLATGRVPFVNYDNDVTGGNGKGANSFGFQSAGTVTLVGGGSAPYSLKRQHIIYADGSAKFNVVRIGPLLR